MQRVVVTGLGAVTPVGLSVEESWRNLLAGCSGVGRITAFDTTGFEVQIAAEVRGFDPLAYLDRKEVRRTDRFVQLAIAAARQAVDDAGIEVRDQPDIGAIVGSGIGGIATLAEQIRVLHERGPSRVSPFLVPMMIVDMASGQVSIQLGCKGPNYAVVSACATGADAIGAAFETIRRGDARAMIAGGTEAAITPIGIAGFAAARALSTRNDDPPRASRPFDAERDGFVMGEGAAVLVLESLESALARGAKIYCELAGYAATADAYHITQPSEGGEGGVRAMRQALRSAGLTADEVDYINAHGTSTELNDKLETVAIKTVFGERAYQIPISSTKSMTGHLLGAAGAFEAVVCAKTIETGWIHPTINRTTPDPECDLDYVVEGARQARVRVALSNSLGFGGHNATLVFRAFEQ
ncbi:MAG: beta-ketoacyl-ACP synthase II [Chloroflexota bacterium]|nr:beta-ketoacyl-ACP synthase II [Dehalococcoidia bacterium]MDW8253875.1 beta-ketoacyl-ACP synthase II [Chloroflexota bacterium]